MADLSIRSIESTKLADENVKNQESREAEGDDLQVLRLFPTERCQCFGYTAADQPEHDQLFVPPQLRLMLPDGREETVSAKLGQTVQYTKAVLHEQFELPMEKQVVPAHCNQSM